MPLWHCLDMWRVKVAFAFFPSTYFHYAEEWLMVKVKRILQITMCGVLVWEHGATNVLFHGGNSPQICTLECFDFPLLSATKSRNFAGPLLSVGSSEAKRS